ncbi:T-cell surface antigen CD2 isoform X2 [Antennarius striatus]
MGIDQARGVTGNGSLKLLDLDQSKAGTYRPQVYHDGRLVGPLRPFSLCVLDSVPEPQVRFRCQPSSVRFTCSVEQQGEELSFEWLQNDKVLENVTNQMLPERTSRQVEHDSVRCRVSNRVSTRTSPPVQQNCTREDHSLLSDMTIWILVGVGGGVALLLLVVVIACCLWKRRRRSQQVKEEEELRLGWTHPHRHPHHHHHQQQPAGHTGPRPHRGRQQRSHPRPRGPAGGPQPSPRRPSQGSRPLRKSSEHPPPLPQPRNKTPRTPRV